MLNDVSLFSMMQKTKEGEEDKEKTPTKKEKKSFFSTKKYSSWQSVTKWQNIQIFPFVLHNEELWQNTVNVECLFNNCGLKSCSELK